MNTKKVVIWGAVIVGTVLIVRHMRKTNAANIAKQAQANAESTSNAIGGNSASQPCGAATEKCMAACQAMGGTWNPNGRTCDNANPNISSPYFAKGRR